MSKSLGRYVYIYNGKESFEVEFDGLKSGTVTKVYNTEDNVNWYKGFYYDNWIPCTDTNVWKPRTYNISLLEDFIFDEG
jgi:hypothetical protein